MTMAYALSNKKRVQLYLAQKTQNPTSRSKTTCFYCYQRIVKLFS